MARLCALVMNGGIFCAVFLLSCGWVFSDSVASDRPSKDGEPTIIHTVIFLVDVDTVDGANQNFTANVFVNLRWFDSRLAHDGTPATSSPRSFCP